MRAKAKFPSDITFLYNTKDYVEPPEVVTFIEDKTPSGLYPNPFHSELYLNGPHVTIINVLGEVVMSSDLQREQPLNTSNLPQGVYFLHVTSDNGKISIFKVVRN